MKTRLLLLLASALTLASCANDPHVAQAHDLYHRTEAAAAMQPGNLGAQLNYELTAYLLGAPRRVGLGYGPNPYLVAPSPYIPTRYTSAQ